MAQRLSENMVSRDYTRTRSSNSNNFTHCSLTAAVAMARYSASLEDRATIRCFVELQELCTFLLFLISFVTSCIDPSLFVYSRGTALIYFLVYVDDLIVTDSDPSLVDTIIRKLNSTLCTKNLGPLSYFYGVEVLATSSGFLLSQQKHVIDMLRRAKR